MNNKTWTVTLEEDDQGGAIIPFPADMLAELGWQEGDTLDFQVRDDGSCFIENLSWQERQKNTVAES